LTKIIGTSTFNESFSISFFFAALHPYIFRNTPCRKNALPFFCQSSIRESFSRFLFRYDFYPVLINVPIIHIEGFWNLPVNPARRVPGFMEEKGR
jgi:hypothetical protein